MEMQLFNEVVMSAEDRIMEEQEQRFQVGGWIGVHRSQDIW